MQIFPMPNQRGMLGVSIQSPNGTAGPRPSRQQYRELERQIPGAMAFASGLTAPRSARGGTGSIARPGMRDRIDGVQVLGGMACRHDGGRPLSLLFVSGPTARGPQPRHVDFCVMKVPSQGGWGAQGEFVLDRSEVEFVSDLLPVMCDPYYRGSRSEGMAEVMRNHQVSPKGMRAVPGTDEATLRKMGTDSRGHGNILMSEEDMAQPVPRPDRQIPQRQQMPPAWDDEDDVDEFPEDEYEDGYDDYDDDGYDDEEYGDGEVGEHMPEAKEAGSPKKRVPLWIQAVRVLLLVLLVAVVAGAIWLVLWILRSCS